MIADTRRTWGYSVAGQSKRRWLVGVYWLAVAMILVGFVRHSLNHKGVFLNASLFNVLFFLPALLGGVRAGGAVKPFRGIRWNPVHSGDGTQTLFRRADAIGGTNLDNWELDERERRERDRVHFSAYTVGRWLALSLFAACAAVDLWRPELLMWLAPGFLFLLVLTLWSLPQTLILWNEPDVEEQ